MATIRFATPVPRGARAILQDVQDHPVTIDHSGLLAVPDDMARAQHTLLAGLTGVFTAGAAPSTGTPPAHPLEPLLAGLQRGELSEPELTRLTDALATPEVLKAMTNLSSTNRLRSMIQQVERLRGLDQLKAVLDDATTTIDDLRAVLRDQAWMFGGRYGRLPKVFADGVDRSIPVLLTRTDGAFHVVEVAEANTVELVSTINDLPVAGPVVQEAVVRAIAQLHFLDGKAAELRELPTYEYLATRRALATVVVGDSRRVDGVTREAIRAALRTFTSHLAGIDVITYDELVEIAERVTLSDAPE